MLLKRKPFGNHKNQNSGPGQLSSGAPGDNGNGNDGFGPGWGDFFSQAGMASDQMKALMEPSDDINKMALRSVFAITDLPDMREVIACYERYNRFNQTRDLENLKLLLSCAPAIGGISRAEYMQGGSRILAESALQHSMDIRSGGIFQKNGKHNKNQQRESKMHYPVEEQESGG